MSNLVLLSGLLFLACRSSCGQECGKGSVDFLCALNFCCSRDGYCGNTSTHCGSGCQSQCAQPLPPSSYSSNQDLVVLIALVVACTAVFLSVAITCFSCLRRKSPFSWQRITSIQLECIDAPFSKFSYGDLSKATKGFRKSLMLGKGVSGCFYKGILPIDGTEVAVKVISVEKHEDFEAEISSLSLLRHKKLVRLKGWCHEHQKLVLAYDYMPNGSLNQHLFSTDYFLDWNQRYEIVKDVAEGLAFLHEGCEQGVIHRNIKATNVLLDSKFVAHLGDFGLSKLMEKNRTNLTGYIAPELSCISKASDKSDVYSFGILLLEVACGRPVFSMNEEHNFLLECVWQAQQDNELLRVADLRLESEYDEEQMIVVLSLGLLCAHPDLMFRPSMKKCCKILNDRAVLPTMPNTMPNMYFVGSFPLSSAANSTSLFKPTNSRQSTGSYPSSSSQVHIINIDASTR